MRKIIFSQLLCCLVLLSLGRVAGACEITRVISECHDQDCTVSALNDFREYGESELACGVRKENLPFIAQAQGTVLGTVVVLHGLLGNPAHMRDVTAALTRAGYNVVVPILFGHGGDDELLTHASFEQWRRDVSFAGNVATKLQGPYYLFGYSTGGALAVVESSEHPARYKAFSGFDPALNLNGPSARQAKYTCLAKKLWSYPNEIGRGFLRPFLGPESDEHPITREAASRENDIAYTIAANRGIADRYCGTDFKIPDYDYEMTLASVCALYDSTKADTAAIKSLPPTLVVFSQDGPTYQMITKADVKAAVMGSSSSNVLYESAAPIHILMMAHCSPGFTIGMRKTIKWFGSHQ